jgi:hypothetical protein
MHERKVEMAKRSCGFIGLPGGYGTFEEVSYSSDLANIHQTRYLQVLEVATWTQVGIHKKRKLINSPFRPA